MNDVIEGLYLRESDDFMYKTHKLWVMDWHKLFHNIYDVFALKSLEMTRLYWYIGGVNYKFMGLMNFSM